MLNIVGLGLGSVRDIAVNALEAVRQSDYVYLEAFTSIMPFSVTVEELENLYGKKVIACEREKVEEDFDSVLEQAKTSDVSFLVIGDPFGATTHCYLLKSAKQKNIPVHVYHNASIITAVGCCGLQLYSYGETVSIVFWTDRWRPESFFDKIEANLARGLHTLCLLDIKVKERPIENLTKKHAVYLPPRYMSVSEATTQLLQIIVNRRLAGSSTHLEESSQCVGLGRVGWPDQRIVSCSLKRMSTLDLGPPLHSLVIVGHTHPLEEEMLEMWRLCDSPR